MIAARRRSIFAARLALLISIVRWVWARNALLGPPPMADENVAWGQSRVATDTSRTRCRMRDIGGSYCKDNGGS